MVWNWLIFMNYPFHLLTSLSSLSLSLPPQSLCPSPWLHLVEILPLSTVGLSPASPFLLATSFLSLSSDWSFQRVSSLSGQFLL
uniref:Uncharacterized protein n=1 Tax=Anguilla anguilla TaxID=7936 RepID=A0A0E9X5N3_ANGAN